ETKKKTKEKTGSATSQTSLLAWVMDEWSASQESLLIHISLSLSPPFPLISLSLRVLSVFIFKFLELAEIKTKYKKSYQEETEKFKAKGNEI
ncbi:hypothetical protein QQP08_026615, partial [Theobroma cacao]